MYHTSKWWENMGKLAVNDKIHVYPYCIGDTDFDVFNQ